MKKTVISYKTIKPVSFLGSTVTCDSFLAYYTYKSKEEAQKEVDEMNENHPEKDRLGNPINWNEIAYFYVNEQEEMY